MRMVDRLFAFLCVALPGPAFAQDAFVETHTGTIASADQYDLYSVALPAGFIVTGTLVCDEAAPGSRPLDPVLSVFFPGSDPADVDNADVYDDDGFGSADDPAGVDCDAFQSSRVVFRAPAAGSYVFRADGFGSATGPYTLVIRGEPPRTVPTLGLSGFVVLAAALACIAFLAQRRRRAMPGG